MKTIYKQEEIFQDIPDDPEKVIMNIPDEIAEAAGFKPGDTIKVSWGDQGTIIITKVEDGKEQ
jgi:bifunctional DNA-binding transcriptional regulator/antitoxin component of YhaV-PrlF toxin-antitoxin module